MTHREIIELRFPTPAEAQELAGRWPADDDSQRPLTAEDLDAIAHPERHYCSVCGDSFASHEQPCKE